MSITIRKMYERASFTPDFIYREIEKGVKEGVLPGYNQVADTCEYLCENGENRCVVGLFLDGVESNQPANILLLSKDDWSLKMTEFVDREAWRALQFAHDTEARCSPWDGNRFLGVAAKILNYRGTTYRAVLWVLCLFPAVKAFFHKTIL